MNWSRDCTIPNDRVRTSFIWLDGWLRILMYPLLMGELEMVENLTTSDFLGIFFTDKLLTRVTDKTLTFFQYSSSSLFLSKVCVERRQKQFLVTHNLLFEHHFSPCRVVDVDLSPFYFFCLHAAFCFANLIHKLFRQIYRFLIKLLGLTCR